MVGQVGKKIFATRTGHEGAIYNNPNSLVIGSGIPNRIDPKITIPAITEEGLSGIYYSRFNDPTYYTA